MNNHALVSAVITTYKRKPDMLKRAIDSVVNQTYNHIEIILVDDSPADYEYRNEVKALADSYKAVGLKYIQHSQCRGACAARNTGIENSKGEYIAFLDDDDEWLPLKTEKQLEKFTDAKTGLVYCGNYVISENSKNVQRRVYKSGYIFDDLIYENFIGSTSFPLCSRKAVSDAGMFDPDMPAAQDFDLWLRIATKYKVDYVDTPLVNYYFHNCGQITNNRERKALAYERILNKNSDYLKKHRKAYAVRILRISEFCAQSDFKKACKLFWKGLFIYPCGFSELKTAFKTLLYCKFKSKNAGKRKTERYILITGGEFYNKGAQAMTLITIDKMREKYPDGKIILFSGLDAKRSSSEKENYKFEVLPFPRFGEAMSLITGLLKNKYYNAGNGKSYGRYKEIFKNADLLIDISGYSLGSNWGSSTNRAYLRRIMLAKHFGIPVYIMPQSLGPFEYTGKDAVILNILIKHYLKYPELIMAREKDGFDSLRSKYKLKNVIKTFDLVLQNTKINLNNVFKNPIDTDEIKVKSGSVAIIPNSKNNKFGNEKALLELYKDIINALTEKGKNIYLMYHAAEDLSICRKIKAMFESNESVAVIEKELNCIEFENTVKQFDFVIASRYHSIVHAYKQGVPAVVFGWALKYRELTGMYSQQKFCFDVRFEIDKEKVLNAVVYISENCSDISEHIRAVTCEIQKSNVYDSVNINRRKK